MTDSDYCSTCEMAACAEHQEPYMPIVGTKRNVRTGELEYWCGDCGLWYPIHKLERNDDREFELWMCPTDGWNLIRKRRYDA